MLRSGVVVDDGSSNNNGERNDRNASDTVGDGLESSKVEYIPLEYAQKKINKLVTDYTTLKSHYDDHISQLNEFHIKTNSEMKDYYETFIKDLKKKALDHLTMVKNEKEILQNQFTQDLLEKDQLIHQLSNSIEQKNNEYTDSLMQLKIQNSKEHEEIKQTFMIEQNLLITKYQSTIFTNDIVSQVEFDLLKKDKQLSLELVINNYEDQISNNIIQSKEAIMETMNKYENAEKTRDEVNSVLKDVLFSIDNDYANTITNQFDDYYHSFKLKEKEYKKELSEKTTELMTALEDAKQKQEEALSLLINEQALQKESNMNLAILREKEKVDSIRYIEQLAEAESRWLKEKEELTATLQKEQAESNKDHREMTSKLVDNYERRIKDLELEIISINAKAQSSLVLDDGMHHIAMKRAVSDLQRQHSALTSSLVRSYEEKIATLRLELEKVPSIDIEAELLNYEEKVEDLRKDVSMMRIASYEATNETATTEAVNPLISKSSTAIESIQEETANVNVLENSLNIQKNLTIAAEKENNFLKETISALEKRIEEMSGRRALLAAMSSRKFSSANLDTESMKDTTIVPALATITANPDVILEDSPATHEDDEATQVIEELEEEVYKLRLELSELTEENLANANEKSILQTQLQDLIKEKRTDVVARFEEDIKQLRSEMLDSKVTLATMKEEKVKLEGRIKEFKDRCDKAESELKERDERELAQLNPTEEKTQLKVTVSKQREDIIMKSKAATAGWDAAASADKRLDIDVDKAYQRGLTEADNRHSFAMSALNEAIEKKEARITDLLVNLSAMEKAKKELEAQLIEANEKAAQGVGRLFALTDEGEIEVSPIELQDARDNLDSAQAEVVEMASRIEGLETALEKATRMVELYAKLSTIYKAGTTEAYTASGIGGSEIKEAISVIKATVLEGTKLWRRGARDSCFDLYMKVCKETHEKLNKSSFAGSPFIISFKDGLDPVIQSTRTGTSKDKDKGAVALRKILDKLLVDCEEAKTKDMPISLSADVAVINDSSGLENELLSLKEDLANRSDNLQRKDTANSIFRRAKAAEAVVDELKRQMAEMVKSGVSNSSSVNRPSAEEGKSTLRSRTAVGVGVSPMEFKKLQKKARELEEQLAKGGGVDKKALDVLEKKYTKQLKDAEAATKKSSKVLEDKFAKLTIEHSGAAEKIDSLTAEATALKAKVKEMSALLTEMEALKSKASQLADLKEQVEVQAQQYAILTEQFKKETTLRKKYKNELEDLKGAIRVYARCRPMAQYELEKGCSTVVKFTDDTTLKVAGSRGEKEFEFDAAFNWNSTQEEVFEDTKRLVESCLDGFNVCVFAYGQTGSGKTHTMTGSPGMPGLTPRVVDEIYNLINMKKHAKCCVTSYFVELYNDNLVDLYWILDNAKSKKKGSQPDDPPKLDIRLDAKNMVYIRNAVTKEANSPAELMDLFNKGNMERHTGATKMNATSSRSHSIFAVMVESVDSVTKKTITGKLSLVDLAGSERAEKTGASTERLKEAQSINKSLSALGDVIAALSEGEKFIPYRNNKLTQLMQDSLGGNAKTLMFVNFSPADYNADETTTSLQYAARVKKIVNSASKQAESEEVTRLKSIIRKLQSGVAIAPDELDLGPLRAHLTNPSDGIEEKVEDNVEDGDVK